MLNIQNTTYTVIHIDSIVSSMCRYFFLNLITEPATTIYGVLFLVVSVVAIAGNVIASIILWKPCMRNKTNRILKSLVVADAFVGLFSCPLYVYELLITRRYLTDSIVYEDVRNALTIWLSSTSALTVVLIAGDRYLLLTKLTNYSFYMNEKRMTRLIVLTWLYPLVVVSMCFVNVAAYRYTYIISITFSTTVICVCYILMLKKLKEKRKRFDSVRSICGASPNTAVSSKHSRPEMQRQVQLTKNVSFLVTCFIICNVPSLVTAIVRVVLQPRFISSEALQQAYLFSLFAGSANSCINPVVYAAKFPEFHRHLKKMLGCQNRNSLNHNANNNTSVIELKSRHNK